MADIRLQSKTGFMASARVALTATTRLAAQVSARPLPPPLRDWLAKLRLLKGVPFAYLVPDERLLPPESIRFFTLDQGWVDTLVDGAMSIGRTLGPQPDLPLTGLEKATFDHAAPVALAATPMLRSRALGLPPAPAPEGPITGFLLRSTVVSDTPGIGVNVYPQGHTPDDHTRDPSIDIVLLDILRFETLGDASDIILCLVAGEAWQVDIHQPPEQFHYGLDRYSSDGGSVTASKTISSFTVSDGQVTLVPGTTATDVSGDFRPGGNRVVDMANLAGTIAQVNNVAALDAAEMGFEMIEGVGTVSFQMGYGS